MWLPIPRPLQQSDPLTPHSLRRRISLSLRQITLAHAALLEEHGLSVAALLAKNLVSS